MTTLTIQIPDTEKDAFLQVIKKFNATVVIDKQKKRTPNPDTIKAINELEAGKGGKVFNSAKELFASL